MEYITESSKQTSELGARISSCLKRQNKACVYALTGNLGSGKTTFVQGFAKGLGISTHIISPTFILMRKYGNFYHLDLYRLENDIENEVLNLGAVDLWQEPGNVMVIEWAEKIKDLLPKDSVWVEFEDIGENKRRIKIH